MSLSDGKDLTGPECDLLRVAAEHVRSKEPPNHLIGETALNQALAGLEALGICRSDRKGKYSLIVNWKKCLMIIEAREPGPQFMKEIHPVGPAIS